MKKYAALLLCSSLSISSTSSAQNRAMNVRLFGAGSGVDQQAIQMARRLIGYAMSHGIIDTVVITAPREGEQLPAEQGMSFCAEAGFNVPSQRFEWLVKIFRKIKPDEGTSFSLHLTDRCPISISQVHKQSCSQEIKQCSDGSWVARASSNCGFSACPGEGPVFCSQDAKVCPNGSWVARAPPKCKFAPCA
ncbi:MAG: hypothetical protein V3U75_03230 [Methylococcaceae bacterium]